MTSKKLNVELKINGIGGSDVIEEVRKDDNLQIEINSKPAKITNSAVLNGSILNVNAEVEISDQAFEAFDSDKPQEFSMAVDIFYNGDVVSKKLETKFKKGKGEKSSLGYLVAFGDVIEKNVTPVKTNPKQTVADKPSDKPKTEVKDDKVTTKRDPKKTADTKPPNSGGQGGKISLGERADSPNLPKPTPNNAPTKPDRTNKDGKKIVIQ